MASSSAMRGSRLAARGGHLLSPVVGDEEESQEMIAPELVFPEEFGETRRSTAQRPRPRAYRGVLVLLDHEQPIKYPLYKNVMTIGRSEQADIQINSDFISRVHARLVSTEDRRHRRGRRQQERHPRELRRTRRATSCSTAT